MERKKRRAKWRFIGQTTKDDDRKMSHQIHKHPTNESDGDDDDEDGDDSDDNSDDDSDDDNDDSDDDNDDSDDDGVDDEQDDEGDDYDEMVMQNCMSVMSIKVRTGEMSEDSL